MDQERIILFLFNRRFDLTEFAKHHPGGVEILKLYNQKDATDKFVEVGHINKVGILEALKNFEIDENGQIIRKTIEDQQSPYIEDYFTKIGRPKL